VPSHDPRTEWIADGCASWITDLLLAVPLLVAAVVLVVVTGMPFWIALLIAAAVLTVARALLLLVTRSRHSED
jgi:ABC-type dipeptide/oligopeptide/nickel transport system permease subunit